MITSPMPSTRRRQAPSCLGALLLGLLPAELLAQTAVQLPTLRLFGGSTTVIVPDQGTVNLGAMRRARTAGSQRSVGGRPTPQVFGGEREVAGLGVGAFVHDLEAIDQALLQEAARRRPDPRPGELQRGMAGLRLSHDPPPLASVAELRRRRSATPAPRPPLRAPARP
jgi:hypothetical protein